MLGHVAGIKLRALLAPVLALGLLALAARAQTCLEAADMTVPMRSSIELAAQRYFDMSARGDSASLRQNSIPALAANFSGVEAAVKENTDAFRGARALARPPFLLTADASEPLARAEFLCGVFGSTGQTAQSAVFVFNGLPPGKYAVIILDVSGGKEGRTLTLILQQEGADWKLGGYYARPTTAAGHNGNWYADKARDYKKKSENHNAWLYFHEAIALNSPANFMSTLSSDRLFDETQSVQPADMPANGNTIDLTAPGSHSYRMTDIFPLAVGDDLDVVVKYASADISNTQKTFQDNMAVIKALVTKFPELREAFSGVVARAVAPNGQDYGSMLPMREIK
ncbi:MAG TPA: hypothetical protein VMT67_14805 [Terriglobales bacterium]|nr:hypothetical protein [Terriglobales bacterium]